MKHKLKKSELRQLIKEELNNFNENKEDINSELNFLKKPLLTKKYFKKSWMEKHRTGTQNG